MSMSSQTSNRRSPLLLTALWISVLIAVTVVLRRLYALAKPNAAGAAQLVALDRAFQGHEALTLAHIVPALAFALLAPVVLLKREATWVQPVMLVLGTAVGVTAYAMSVFAIGGSLERAAVLLFDSLFLYWLWRAYRKERSGDAKAARRSWIRSVAILFGIATTRPVMGFFFATSRLTGLKPEQFFGLAFWIGFSINMVVVEWWLRKRPQSS